MFALLHLLETFILHQAVEMSIVMGEGYAEQQVLLLLCNVIDTELVKSCLCLWEAERDREQQNTLTHTNF